MEFSAFGRARVEDPGYDGHINPAPLKDEWQLFWGGLYDLD